MWTPSAFERAFRPLARLFGGLILAALTVDCYDVGNGTDPPRESFYFPVGLAVSSAGNVLYVANSDFDLQYNGGTLQSYDLALIRQHAVRTIQDPNDPELPLAYRDDVPGARCPDRPRVDQPATGERQPLGATCAPPTDSSFYVRDSAIIGAFATEVLRSEPPSRLTVPAGAGDALPPIDRPFDRLFVPVRGDAAITWADVARDHENDLPPRDRAAPYGPWQIECGVRTNGRCDRGHQAGNNADENGNSRRITMPGEPFGIAMSDDGEALVVSHQTANQVSLLATGLSRSFPAVPPSLQFIADEIVYGGVGVASIPHDRDAAKLCADGTLGCAAQAPRPAYLLTSRASAEANLIRYYSDEGGGAPSAVRRPYLVREGVIPLTANAAGFDSRGLAIDPTPRLACKARVRAASAGRPSAEVERDLALCGRKPARVFIANRAPASLLIGEIGDASSSGVGAYDPDQVRVFESLPLSVGPSRVYLAPVVDRAGKYALRVFVVCFDSATVFVYDPDTRRIENVLRTGPGPFAMAFDPFDLEAVAERREVPADPRFPGLLRYRFAYVASFTQSYVQLLDLDGSRDDKSTFETVVFTLGKPTLPKGS